MRADMHLRCNFDSRNHPLQHSPMLRPYRFLAQSDARIDTD